MKTVYNHLIIKISALCFVFLSVGQVMAQEVPEGVSLSNQWLKFESQDILQSTLEQLGNQYQDWARTPGEEGNEEEPCTAEEGSPLEAFENAFEGYTSLRKSELYRECAFLEEGGDPADYDEIWLDDDLVGTLVSQNRNYQVGEDIFWLASETVTIKVQGADVDALYAVMAGANPYNFNNVVLMTNDSTSTTNACEAEFEFSGFSGTTGSFSFTGSPENVPNATVSYKWTFGDGNSSTDRNPSHTFSSTGNYNVCVEITVTSSDPNVSCTDQACKTIEVGEDCMPPLFVWNETGAAGQVHFTDMSSFLSGTITSWSWDFGDGNTSTQQHPTHTYACDKTYWVSLTVTTDNGCQTSISIPIEVTSHNCCGKAKDKGEVLYSNGNNKIKYNQHHINIPFIHKVVAKVKNYKRKSNGKFKKQRGDLKIDLAGQVFTKNGVGCKCEMPHSINSTGTGFNKKSYTLSKSIGQGFRAKIGNAWSASYTVNGSHVATKTSHVYCK